MKDVNKSVKNNESAKNDKQTVEQRTDSLLRLCYENANVILLFVVVILSFCYSDRLSLSHKITRNQYTDNTFQKNELQKNEKNNYLQQSGWEAIACDSATAC